MIACSRMNTRRVWIQLLELGQESDRDAIAGAGLSSAGQELMSLWDQMDKGKVKPEAAFDKADAAVKRKQAELEP